MGFFSNPLGHAGYPADPTTAQVKASEVRAATTAEVTAATANNLYISPATLTGNLTLRFDSPPPIGSGTPNTGQFTTLNVGTDLVSGTIESGTATFTSTAAGSLSVDVNSVAGASPVANNSRAGSVGFTNTVATTAYVTLTMNNSLVTSSSIILASASCSTVNSGVSLVGNVPATGSVAFRVLNNGTATTAANININFWILN